MIDLSKSARKFAGASLLLLFALLGGIIAARISALSQNPEHFSLVGFVFGFCMMPIFVLLILVHLAIETKIAKTKLLFAVLCYLLATLVLFALSLYTDWHWAKVASACGALGFALGVFSRILFISLGPWHEA